MTNEDINQRIAEACGWKEVEPWLNGDRCFELNQSVCGYRIEDLPDYCNCLNAMHEAYSTLTEDKQWEFVKTLVNYTQGSFPLLSRSESLVLAKATARQRAEAFLKTVGKWEE